MFTSQNIGGIVARQVMLVSFSVDTFAPSVVVYQISLVGHCAEATNAVAKRQTTRMKILVA